MDRLVQRNVLAMSGRAVEAAGDVSTLLLDKTGHDHARQPPGGRASSRLRASTSASSPRSRSSRRSPTRRPRAARSSCSPRSGSASASASSWRRRSTFVPFTAQTRMSGVDVDGSEIRKGRRRRDRRVVGQRAPAGARRRGRAHRAGGRHAAGRRRRTACRSGVIELKDIVKEGLTERFAQLRTMGIRTVMITGDNPLTAAAIAQESGVDDFLAEATPEAKMDAHQAASRQGGQPRRDDRRRHERRARAGAGRRRRRDEHRHAARPRRPATWSTSTPTRRS